MGLVVLAVAAALYLLPTVVAAGRNKRNTGAIFALNLFLGWTAVGWVVALVWAVAYEAPRVVQVAAVAPPSSDRAERLARARAPRR